jgi:hypothetical protein
MTIPKTHNDYDRLKRQLGDDAVRRVGKLIADDSETPGLSEVEPDDLFVSIRPRLEFSSPVWTGTYEAPQWSTVEVQDGGGWVFSVTYDWTQSTVTVECV